MDAEIFAEWLRRQGHDVVRTQSSYWYDAGPRTFQAFPYHWLISPSAQELRQMIRCKGVAALRYSTNIDANTGMVSYHIVRKRPYEIKMLGAKHRENVRRGLRHCKVECISFEMLAQGGWKLQQDTLDRQGRSRSMDESEWKRICLAAKGLPGFESWGATVKGELASALLAARIDDTLCFLFGASHRKYHGMRVNNALYYSVSHEILSREGVDEISWGLHSLDAPKTVDEFKFRMGYIAKPVRQRVVLGPWLQPFVNNVTHRILIRLRRRYARHHILAKAEGMLRFHLQGKRPLYEQEWPECLGNTKNGLFEGLECSKKSIEVLEKETGRNRT